MKDAVAAAMVAAVGAMMAVPTAAQEESMTRNSKVFDYFQAAADETVPKLAWNASTEEEHAAWRKRMDAKLRELLGRTPDPVPLEVDWAEKMETDAFVRHKIYVRSERNYWVPAYYFVPKGLKGETPAIVCLHGHSGIMPYIGEGTEAEREKSRAHALDYAVYLAEHGYITLAAVQRGWNETRHDSRHDTPHSCHRVTMDAFLIGMTPVGLRTWDAMRLVDFLETQAEVDSSRIGAAGLSGGGTTTLFFAAQDQRIKAALVAGYFCTFRDSIYTIHHCICNCVPHIMEWAE
ncbi:MAG: acetylxylan esterase, partial [Candidatus Hydrogenedentes bacterium]|nr:acetylxylan esterase [Candidatus Hydrogenedentota bacterium]